MNANIHLIIAPTPYNYDPIKYRRQRLVLFLLGLQETKQVIWVAAKIANNIKEINQQPKQMKLPDNLLQITVPDYKSLVKHLKVFQRNLVSTLQQPNNNFSYYLWYTYPAFSSLIDMNHWEKVIYDCSDMWREAEKTDNRLMNVIKKKLIMNTESKIMKSADICFASSTSLYSQVKLLNSNVNLVENGVDFEHINGSRSIVSRNKSKPTFGFVGGLKPWKIDFKLLLNVAKKRLDWNFVFVGDFYGEPTQHYKELLSQQNVIVHPSVPFEEIPGIIQGFDVGLLPYLNNEYNQGVFPLKFYEYLASGIPVVGCGLPSTKEKAEKHVYNYVENNVNQFVAACDQVLNNSAKYKEKRIELAKEADWNKKLQYMWDIVKSD